MERRELLKQIAILTGGIVIGGEVFLSGCNIANKPDAGFSESNIALLNEVAETIIPSTSTPGAKAAQVGEFMKVIVTDCYTLKQQEAFVKGISELEDACKKVYKKSFKDITSQQRHDFLVNLEKEAKEFNKNRDEADIPKREAQDKANEALARKDRKEFESTPSHYYTMIKQLTLWGFFTSKTGATESLRYVAVPGRYEGAMPYKKGDRAWG